ncbi:hypothetical protein C5Y97_11725 [Blastopirellula marina]|uniref:Uncharacterized protein n=1 Tax=Blastopirellula marina TaxID=124 RepID=A0A2S8FWV5_9BACT|nr:hypothetical protein C5Y98_11715 [Blastopirellula marina]PTL44485.1 hypothetical protein C5Y97_11725 [Blastopirellula marina]
MDLSAPQLHRSIAFPLMASCWLFLGMTVGFTNLFVRFEKPRMINYDGSVVMHWYFDTHPFLWPVFLGITIWGGGLLTKQTVQVRSLFLYLGVTGNLAVAWIAWTLLVVFQFWHSHVLRLEPDAPFL